MARFFTEEELEELRRADAELDEEYRLTPEDIAFSRRMDREAKFQRLDNRGRRSAAQQAAYREANREKIAARQAAYREANREKIADYQAAYREANREKYNAYMREYLRKRREAKKAASGAGTSESSNGNKSTYILTV